MPQVAAFERTGVRGFFHRADADGGDGLVLTHGASSNCEAPLLVALAESFAGRGVSVLRCDLPFRQRRLRGPPSPASAAADRDGIRNAVAALRQTGLQRLFLGGHSYGGRQATLAVAETPDLAQALLLLSYPLHPPGKPERLRREHFPRLRQPTLFVHGTADPFGSVAELEAAMELIPAATRLLVIERASHDLKRGRFDLASIVAALLELTARAAPL